LFEIDLRVTDVIVGKNNFLVTSEPNSGVNAIDLVIQKIETRMDALVAAEFAPDFIMLDEDRWRRSVDRQNFATTYA